MKRFSIWQRVCLMALILMFSVSICAAATVEEKRQSTRNMTQDTLERLYKVHPTAKDAVEAAEGYAVFSNWDVKILFVGGGTGRGMTVNNNSKQETFMKMVAVDAGLGLGAKTFRLIFVFENQEAMDKFIKSGWEFGGQATAAATDSVNGASLAGAFSVSPGIWMYQLTEKGLALELTVKGTKYYKDKDLN